MVVSCSELGHPVEFWGAGEYSALLLVSGQLPARATPARAASEKMFLTMMNKRWMERKGCLGGRTKVAERP